MAAELARYGLRVRIVEKAAQCTDKSKAVVIWSRTLELMDRMGCAASFVAAGFKAAAANISAGDKPIAHVDLTGVATPYPYALMLPQSDTERLLGKHLESFGVRLERNLELLRFTSSKDGVVSTLHHADGREETVESTWLVGCDGAHSTVRHQLGMSFTGDTLNSDWILADLHLSQVPRPDEISVLWHSEGVLAVFPLGADRYRVIADSGVAISDARRPDPTLEEVQEVMDRRGPGGIRASAPVWLAAFRINERKVADYRAGRVFLAGDAAHIHSPAGGQGMNTGMQDAFNLAWKLALVCRGHCAESPLLDSYSVERSAVGDQVLAGAGRLTAVAIMRGKVKQSIRNHVAALAFGLAPVRRRIANAMTEISIGYPKGPLTAKGVRGIEPCPGQRAPVRAGEAPVGAGNAPRFAVLAEPDEESARLFAQFPDLLEPAFRKPLQPDGLWLVRPDGYVAVASRCGDWSPVLKFLSRLTAAR